MDNDILQEYLDQSMNMKHADLLPKKWQRLHKISIPQAI